MSIQRYKIVLISRPGGNLYADIQASEDGDYVLYSDFLSALSKSQERVKELEAGLKAFVDWDTKYPKGRDWHHSQAYQIERELDALCDSARSILGAKEGEK